MAVNHAHWRASERRKRDGFALLELTLAVGIFIVVLGVAAQSLILFYAAMDMQKQRTIAVNECRTVLSQMRAIRSTNPNSEDDPANFQDAVLSQYPDGATVAGPANLRNSEMTVTYEDPSANANPLVPTVTLQWVSLTGREVTVNVSSALADN